MLENEVRPMVEQFLHDRGLQLSPEKTCITHIDEGFDFLGQNIRKFSGKLLIRPSKKNTHNFLEKVRKITRDSRSRHQLEMIQLLNPVVRGWVNYHRHVVVKKAFRKVEMVMWKCLWRWAKRRHPGKPTGWIVSKYWHHLDGRKVFAADTGDCRSDGSTIWSQLISPVRTPIRRHIKIKQHANPFDACWFDYFKERAFWKRFGISRTEAGLKPSS
jgi:RNA-directed DNA polymerase